MLKILTSPLRRLASILDHISDSIAGKEDKPSRVTASSSDMATIEGITGQQFVKGTQAWENNRYQYATSSHGIDHDMNPQIVVQPRNKEDIKTALKYAKERGIAVAIRTGGHQYSFLNRRQNIQLDLQRTFRSPDDLKVLPSKDGKAFVYTSVSHSISELNTFLGSNSLFVPHGQCSHVHIGGHVQTGGYGQLGRSFGLFGDHVRSITLINADSQEIEITKLSDPELFYALLGGSPGNFGVITHIVLEVHQDKDYPGAMGLRALFLYNKETVERLISYVAEMSDNPDYPRNYDLCVSVLSSSFPLRALWPGLDSEIKEEHPGIYGEDRILGWPKSIIVYAQWVPFSDEDREKGPNPEFFARLQRGNPIKIFQDGVVKKPLSEMTKMWLFEDVREFDLPYEERRYLTKSTSLVKDEWPKWVTGRIDELVAPINNFCWLSCQIQAFGGKNSRLVTNADNGTSYSWRNSTVCATLDAFHWSERKGTALEWQAKNDGEGIGENGIFSKQDRRVLWGSYGEFEMDRVWDTYFEDKEKYERLGKVRSRMDPYGTFTPNGFCVKKA